VAGEVVVLGIEPTVLSFRLLGNQAKQYAMAGVMEAQKIAYAAAMELLSAADHPPEVLRAMGHPYARRAPAPPHETPTVHVIDDDYREALKAEPPRGLPDEIVEGRVGIDPENELMTQRDRWIQMGTTKMIERPWAQFIFDKFKNEMAEAIRLAIQIGMRRDVRMIG
jgi:hypothetical protein